MKLKLLFLLLVFQVSFAQHRTCGMEERMQEIMNDPAAREQYLQLQARFETELERLSMQARNVAGVNGVNDVQAIRIPVAVHFPSAGAASATVKTCLRALAQNQINILNADYNGLNADISNWNDVSADYPGTNTGSLDVQFELATQNHPAGTGLTNGTVAVTFGTDFLNGDDEDLTWAGYMNLVVRNEGSSTLGYSPLGGSPAGGHTVVINRFCFGSGSGCTGYVPSAPYNLGRTLTHELGHFFNLNHTFVSCGTTANCSTSGDRVCDTPPTNQPRYDCNAADNPPSPSIPGNPPLSTCGFLQLTMNYMDYVEDACMYMFTAGQAARMQAYYNTISSQFTTTALANTEVFANSFKLYPNPNKGSFNIEFKELTNSYSVEVFDVTGQVIFDDNFDLQSSLIQTINLQNTSSGIYFINIKNDLGVMVTKKLIIE